MPELRDDLHNALMMQNLAFARAMAIYEERFGTYGDAWKDFPMADTIMHIESKLARMKAAIARNNMADAREQGIDLINYGGFAVRRLSGEE